MSPSALAMLAGGFPYPIVRPPRRSCYAIFRDLQAGWRPLSPRVRVLARLDAVTLRVQPVRRVTCKYQRARLVRRKA